MIYVALAAYVAEVTVLIVGWRKYRRIKRDWERFFLIVSADQSRFDGPPSGV